MKLFYDSDPDFDGQLQRTVAKVVARQAELGEGLATAARIPPGDEVAGTASGGLPRNGFGRSGARRRRGATA
jgi:hypothetical protein